MRAELPLGDVVDRLSILAIKRERLVAAGARENAVREAAALHRAWSASALPSPDALPEWGQLCAVNLALWDVEDALRAHEARADFGPDFVALARSVYRLNDERAALKRSINLSLGSELVEEKSYGARAADEL